MKRGVFISFEGIDGSGKTTQVKVASEWMERAGLPVVTTREPGTTKAGEAIRDILKYGHLDPRAQALLSFASRQINLADVILPALTDGRNVLCDGFTDCGEVYEAPHLPPLWFGRLDHLITGGRRPHYTVLLDLPPEVARERAARGRGGDHFDGSSIDVFRDRRIAYLELAEAERTRFFVIDATGSVRATSLLVQRALKQIFPEASP